MEGTGDNVSTVERTEVKKKKKKGGEWVSVNCYVTPHEASNGRAHSLREIINSLLTNIR